MEISFMTWREIRDLPKDNAIAVIPLGSTEQHGLHLPLNTDTLLVQKVAAELEKRLPCNVVLLSAVSVGHSPHHEGFGAVSSSYRNVASHITDIITSLYKMEFKKVFLLNGHGGNRLPINIAMQEMKDRKYGINIYAMDYWNAGKKIISEARRSSFGGMGHSCELETSLMMYFYPEQVRKSLIRDDGTIKSEDFFGNDMFRGGEISIVENFEEFTESGVYGKPSLASAESGKIFSDAIIGGLIEIIQILCVKN